jgi:HD-GYP domain-containing protein (c-di-GMP phosphodiesterase class II)
MLSAAAVREVVQTAACLPLKVDGQIVGGLDVCFKSAHSFAEDELNILSILAQQAAVAIYKAQLLDQVHYSYLSTIHALAAAVEAKDPYTRGHSERVRRLAVATGQEMGLDERQLQLLNLAALFHDIGKIGVPESILSKPTPPTPEEMDVLRQHPVWAEPILRHIPDMPELVTIVRHHHERYDGQGYPDGVSSRDHPLSAIIFVADAYDAMTSERPYRKALSHHAALEEIRRHAGTQFVPQVVEAFVRVMAQQSKVLSLEDYRVRSVVSGTRVAAKPVVQNIVALGV